jgi:hypothetical protein
MPTPRHHGSSPICANTRRFADDRSVTGMVRV